MTTRIEMQSVQSNAIGINQNILNQIRLELITFDRKLSLSLSSSVSFACVPSIKIEERENKSFFSDFESFFFAFWGWLLKIIIL